VPVPPMGVTHFDSYYSDEQEMNAPDIIAREKERVNYCCLSLENFQNNFRWING
jgi:hypothetical protein